MFVNNKISQIRPDEIYNLAAQSHVGHSFDNPDHTFQVNINGLMHVLQACVTHKLHESVKIFHASTSEMFGDGKFDTENEEVITEDYEFFPMSPYSVSKVSAFYLVKYYRAVFNMFVCTGMTFNHESPLRHPTFVTRKITKAVARIKRGLQENVKLGNIYSKRDWGYAWDYVKGFWLMLNKNAEPKDYVLSTQQCASVKEFCEEAFKEAGYNNTVWVGEGVEEKLIDQNTGKALAEVVPEFYRPGEVPYLRGSSARIKADLGWEPKVMWRELLSIMLAYDLSTIVERPI